jgi:hypothetical protein
MARFPRIERAGASKTGLRSCENWAQRPAGWTTYRRIAKRAAIDEALSTALKQRREKLELLNV